MLSTRNKYRYSYQHRAAHHFHVKIREILWNLFTALFLFCRKSKICKCESAHTVCYVDICVNWCIKFDSNSNTMLYRMFCRYSLFEVEWLHALFSISDFCFYKKKRMRLGLGKFSQPNDGCKRPFRAVCWLCCSNSICIASDIWSTVD